MATLTRTLGGILLVSGTCMGGGMLALPVLTGLGGFIPSLVMFFSCWVFMTSTGLLFLETCHWMGKETNIVSMAERTLGAKGRWAAWGLYLFLFYCLTLAYIVGCGNLVTEVFPLPEWAGSLLFVLMFAPVVVIGPRFVGRINALLMLGLGVSYCLFVWMGYSFVNFELLLETRWESMLMALPVAFTSFGFQGIVPTLFGYMQYDVRKTRLAILIGSLLPFLAYIIWEALILGIVPVYGPGGLLEALQKGENAVQPLKTFIGHPKIYVVGQFFAFFALATSFFGVTLGLLDFLADGLRIHKDMRGKCFLSLLVFIPPLLIAMWDPTLFLVALEYAGGFGCALLLGMLPILMVWSGRYYLRLPSKYLLPGGKWALSFLFLFVFFEVVYEALHRYLCYTQTS